MADADNKQKPPECTRVITCDGGARRKCKQPAYWRNIHGEFGLKAELLCNKCVAQLKLMGWKIRYMLEGDAPKEGDESNV